VLWQTTHEPTLCVSSIISKTNENTKYLIGHVHWCTCARAITSCASEMWSQNAILSVDRIRYRYGWPAAVHGINIANRSGDHMARRMTGIRASDDMERTTEVVACRVLCRKAGTPRNHMRWRIKTERRSHPPLTRYMRNADSKYFTPSISSLTHDTTHWLHYHVDRGFVCNLTHRLLDYMLLCTGTLSLLTSQVVYLYHIEPAMLPPRLSTIPVLTTL
jgi:hypothetical protein